jgi:hypothetical protein
MPPVPQPAAPAPAAPQPADSGGQYDVHKCAVDAEKALEKLATELAHAGAPKNVTGTVTKMADAVRSIVTNTGGKPAPAAQPAPQPSQPHTMSSAANSLVADVAARKAQGG